MEATEHAPAGPEEPGQRHESPPQDSRQDLPQGSQHEQSQDTPQDPPRPKRRWPLVPVLLLLCVAVLWWKIAPFSSPAPPPKDEAIPVVEGRVEEADVPIYLEGLGSVQAWNTVTLHVRVDGQLQHVAFEEGQDVREGDLLARIDPAPYAAQLAQAEARQKQDEAQLANARLNLRRDTQLRKENVISQQEFDNQKALADQLEATVLADAAAVQNLRVQLGYTTLYAPVSGRIGIRLVDRGNIVHASDPGGLIVITQLRPIAVIFTLPEQNLPEIQRQMAKGPLKVFAVGRDAGQPGSGNVNKQPVSEGVLRVVDNQIDPATGTIRLKAEFPNDDLQLWPGQFVNARLLIATRKGARVVPAQSVLRGPEGADGTGGEYVFVITENRVSVRPVKVGPIRQGRALIESGVEPGERIVVEGQYRLQAHSRVSIHAAATPAATPAPNQASQP